MTPTSQRSEMRRPGALRLGILASVMLAFVALGPTVAPRVDTVTGPVEIGRGEPIVWVPAHVGDALAPGDTIRTGRDGRVALNLGSGTVRLYGDTLLRLPPGSIGPRGAQSVDVERGHSLFEILRREKTDPFDVRAPEVVVSVKGTRFGVEVRDAGAAVSVYRGLVGVRGSGADIDHETMVREGFVAVGGRDRPFELFLHEAADPWDSWSQHAEPPALPDRAIEQQSPSREALIDALGEAERASGPRVLEEAMRRHPKLAERVAQLQAERNAQQDDGIVEPVGEELDGVLDATDSTRRELVDFPYAEALANDPTGGGGTTTFDIKFVDGSGTSGSDVVVIGSQSGTVWTFDEGFLEDVLDGSDALPPDLLTELQNQGVTDPAPLVQTLLTMFP